MAKAKGKRSLEAATADATRKNPGYRVVSAMPRLEGSHPVVAVSRRRSLCPSTAHADEQGAGRPPVATAGDPCESHEALRFSCYISGGLSEGPASAKSWPASPRRTTMTRSKLERGTALFDDGLDALRGGAFETLKRRGGSSERGASRHWPSSPLERRRRPTRRRPGTSRATRLTKPHRRARDGDDRRALERRPVRERSLRQRPVDHESRRDLGPRRAPSTQKGQNPLLFCSATLTTWPFRPVT
jgi:hypothetical protein